MTLPNAISTLRILLVPIVIWAMISGEMLLAFLVFMAAGASDAIDGFLARRFQMTSELGAWLDPVADKLLLMSAFVTFGFLGLVPLWLAVMVVSRDVLIMAAVVLGALVGSPFPMQPLTVSKINTVATVLLAGWLLLDAAVSIPDPGVGTTLIFVVSFLTLASGVAYLRRWTIYVGDHDQNN